jgi:hypothetical protein
VKRVLAVIASCGWLFALWAAVEQPVAAAGPSLQTVQFNLCSRKCSEEGTAGGTYTNYGIYPVQQMQSTFGAKGHPRVFSLNEVCGPGLYTFVAGLPANAYAVSFFVAKHNGGSCGEFGNVAALRTLDIPASNGDVAAFYYNRTTPIPPSDRTEYRNIICGRSRVYLEHFQGCSSHTITNIQNDSYLATLEVYWGTMARMGLGDLNEPPTSLYMENWEYEGYADAGVGWGSTHASGSHIDYAWYHTSKQAGPDAGGTAYSTTSDHFLLWSPIHFK